MDKYPIVPGRGLVTKSSLEARIAYLKEKGFPVSHITKSELMIDQIAHNIESHIGSVEVPVGLAGPLLLRDNKNEELIHAPVGTLEGALLASMNRGAKAVSLSGGFTAAVLHQKMVRTPMFIFTGLPQALHFKSWLEDKFDKLREITSHYSNHAKLIKIEPVLSGRSVHVHFVYTTGDASGQNMTTSCTWQAIQWIQNEFETQTNISPVHALIEGNGASDKKVSVANMNQGRGINVVAECILQEEHIRKILRTNADDMLACFNASKGITQLNGMMSANINVANAIAGIYVATGQDLASIHESATGILMVEKCNEGLYLNLQLPSLVIGTVGGGTHLPAQQEGLELMKCLGTNKVERFAKIIAGFALSLEISTFAAIVGGQFASAHERLGRNKPVNWITRSEINTSFISGILKSKFPAASLTKASINYTDFCDNGILMHLAQKVNKKPKGFIVMDLHWTDSEENNDRLPGQLLIKSKSTGIEAIKGLHLMASLIDPELAREISNNSNYLEYKQCHLKEIAAYEILDQLGFDRIPAFYGSYSDEKREIFMIMIEFLRQDALLLFNSEEHPELWTDELILAAIDSIHAVHSLDHVQVRSVREFPLRTPRVDKAISLYRKMAEILVEEYRNSELEELTSLARHYVEDLQKIPGSVVFKKCWVHNDFNPRNVAVRSDNRICIYDWELSMLDFPQRDLVEFLSFVLEEDLNTLRLEKFLKYHYNLYKAEYSFDQWKQASIFALKEYLATRVMFYMNGRIILDFGFAERIFKNTMAMILHIESIETWER